MIIQIWNSLKSVLGLQDQGFKNFKKWMPPYIERGSSLGKCFSLFRYNLPKTHQLSHETWFLILVMFTSSTNLYIKCSSSDNLTNWWLMTVWIWWIFDTEETKNICILDNLFNCWHPHQHNHLKEKKEVPLYKNSKILFLKRKFHLFKT